MKSQLGLSGFPREMNMLLLLLSTGSSSESINPSSEEAESTGCTSKDGAEGSESLVLTPLEVCVVDERIADDESKEWG
jgi:hypothetical protein